MQNISIEKFYAMLNEVETYKNCINRLMFDMECIVPKNGITAIGKEIAFLNKKINELQHSEEYIDLLNKLYCTRETLNTLDKKLIEYLYDEYLKKKNITSELSYKLTIAYNNAYENWLEAKRTNQFSAFEDSFNHVVELHRYALSLRHNRIPTSLYDNCLNDYEPGMTSDKLDIIFSQLKTGIIEILNNIKHSNKIIKSNFLNRKCSINQQEDFSRYILEKEGLKKNSSVFMTTEHPFTMSLGIHDVRVTTHYYEDNFLSNMFTILHEGGHALFAQNEPSIFFDKCIAGHFSQAMTECIARFYENIIGRSKEFIQYIYPEICKFFPNTFDDISAHEMYEAVNIVKPSLIRMDADELTYCLHIIIRYEIEKAFINGEITIDKVPYIWNKKYKEYLGIDVPNDTLGCLQDVHWTSDFGYFPSYALGNAYGAQILNQIIKEFDFYGAIQCGDFTLILDWFKKNVFNCSSILSPDEWIIKITGEPLNVNYYIQYLKNKYYNLYEV